MPKRFFTNSTRKEAETGFTTTTPQEVDGFMLYASKTPLGESLFKNKTEKALIKPVSKMVKHLSSKGGMFLIETYFVFGDESLHYDFKKIAAVELKINKVIKRQSKASRNSFPKI